MTQLLEMAKPEIEQLENNRARIVFGPLERGHGHTLGNALRRLLLSSIPGAAVVEVRIKGVQHECDTIEGVREDVIEILLNLKDLAVQLLDSDEDAEAVLALKQKGPAEVTASMFELPAGAVVANPELYLCTLTNSKTELDMQVKISIGRGFQAADQRESQEEKTIGDLEVDATFSPVRRVSYQVENVRVAGQTDLDRLVLTLLTNGTVSPSDAVGHAASLLQRQLQPLAVLSSEVEVEEQLDPIMTQPIESLDMEQRIANILRENLKIDKVGDLVRRTEVELLETPRLATKSVDKLKELLAERGLMLGMSVPGWPED